MPNFDIVQDLFKPVLLVAVGALAYFIRAQFIDIKTALDKLTDRYDDIAEKFVKKDDCLRMVNNCHNSRNERRHECDKQIEDLRLITSDLVSCVNKHVDSCEVKQR
jgi:hypothetical protein